MKLKTIITVLAICAIAGGGFGIYKAIDNANKNNSASNSTVHTHKFDKQVAETLYLKSEANCQAKATYYYSCECGEKGTDTFEIGVPDPDAHVWNDNDCSNCIFDAGGSKGLVWEKNYKWNL